mgnify:CR=1 FL=1
MSAIRPFGTNRVKQLQDGTRVTYIRPDYDTTSDESEFEVCAIPSKQMWIRFPVIDKYIGFDISTNEGGMNSMCSVITNELGKYGVDFSRHRLTILGKNGYVINDGVLLNGCYEATWADVKVSGELVSAVEPIVVCKCYLCRVLNKKPVEKK